MAVLETTDKPPISEQEIGAARAKVALLEPAVAAARTQLRNEEVKLASLAAQQSYYRFLSRFRGVGNHFELWPVGLTLVIPSATCAMIWMLGVSMDFSIARHATFLLLGASLSIAICSHLLWVPSSSRIRDRLTSIEGELVATKTASDQSRIKFNGLNGPYLEASQHHASLVETVAKWRLQKDRERQERLRSVQYKREQLFARNWRAMRSVEFELFLKEVFEALGYQVEKTRVTGDQGVDLIVSYQGRRIAVQVKGYFNSVSNGAVQEAFAGHRHYHCSGCAVITNSRFTASARELAQSVGCTLIDEEGMQDFVMGRLLI